MAYEIKKFYDLHAGDDLPADFYAALPKQEAKRYSQMWDKSDDREVDYLPIQTDAVEFAEWMGINYWRYLKSSAKWTNRDDDLLTTEELYKLYKLFKNKQ